MYEKYTPSCGSLLKVLVKQTDTILFPIILKHKSDKWSKKLSTRDQLEILVSAHLVQAKSLGDISEMIKGTGKFSCSSINKSSLSRINQYRDSHIFEKIYETLLKQVRKRIPYSSLRVIDSTSEVVNQTLFPLWPYDDSHSAIKVTVIFDPYYELPDQVVISTRKVGDMQSAHKLPIKRGITYLIDGGFHDYSLYEKYIDHKAYFIIRQHYNAKFEATEELPITESDVISDQIGFLGKAHKRMRSKTRLIRLWGDDGKEMLISTNRFDLPSETIRQLYRKRWDIEVFFKFLKQNLKLKKFFGGSINAVKTQIYCALIAYLLTYLLKPKQTRMSEFIRKIHYALFLDFSKLTFFDTS